MIRTIADVRDEFIEKKLFLSETTIKNASVSRIDTNYRTRRAVKYLRRQKCSRFPFRIDASRLFTVSIDVEHLRRNLLIMG